MEAGEDPSPLMDAAMREVCDAATAKTVYLLPSAEETSTLPTFHKWTLQMSDIYNRGPAGAIIYNTYQAYLRQTPATISQHLQEAQKAGYTLGIKLVRGAYMGTEPRQLIWGSAEETHNAYDSVTSAILRRKYDGLLPPPAVSKIFPPVHVVLATHNAASTRKAQAIRKQQLQDNEPLVPLMYAQLQGMADEISCELLAEARVSQSPAAPMVYKYSPWGTMTQCLGYLLRRAGENKDAAGRTLESRIAMGQELRRRFRALFGIA